MAFVPLTRILAIGILTIAFVLSILVTISLPSLPLFDITRSYFNSTIQLNGTDIQALRLGIWAPCSYSPSGSTRNCLKAGYGYTVSLSDTLGNDTATIHPGATGMLSVHPAATAVTFLAVVCTLIPHLPGTWMSFLAAVVTLVAFVVEAVFLRIVKHELRVLDVPITTKPGPGFWMTLTSFVLVTVRILPELWRLVKKTRSKPDKLEA